MGSGLDLCPRERANAGPSACAVTYPFLERGRACDTCGVFTWTFLAPFIFLVLACTYGLRHLLGVARLRREHLEVLATGLPASGQVLKLDKTGRAEGTRLYPVLELQLELEVNLPGRPPYTVQTRQLVDEIRVAMVQPGSQVDLRVDAKDPQRVVVTDVASATDGGAPKPLFDLQRSRASLIIVSAATLLGVGFFVSFGAFRYWTTLNAPADGFCAAAVRCCNLLPPEPMVDPAVIKHLDIQLDPCSLSPEATEAACQAMYEHYYAQAQKAGLSCE